MKFATAALFALIATPALADAVTYEGTLGPSRIVLELSAPIEKAEAPLAGRYFYRTIGGDIPLHGLAVAPGNLELAEELPCTEKLCAVAFEGGTMDPPLGAHWTLTSDSGKTITGTWGDGTKSLPIALELVGSRPLPDFDGAPLSLAAVALDFTYSGADLSLAATPYEFLKMETGSATTAPETSVDGGAYTYVTDPRTKFAYPRIVRLDGADPAAANAYLEHRHWDMNMEALSCVARQYLGFGWGPWVAYAAGGLANYDAEVIEVTYLSPTLMSFTESGSTFCGGAHPYNHHAFTTLDIKTGEYLDIDRIFAASTEELAAFVIAHRVPDSAYEAECGYDELIPMNLTISFKQGDRVLFALDDLPHAIQACGDDLYEAPIGELRQFPCSDGRRILPLAQRLVTSRSRPAIQPAMNRIRATYSYWYFTTDSRWQPEGRV